jgi:HEAT repeat protein
MTTIYPALTISLLSQLTDRELQSNYLNHLNRTDEIANLLTQIEERDLVLRIINLALEVDLRLAAKLTASLTPELQQIIIEQIDSPQERLRQQVNSLECSSLFKKLISSFSDDLQDKISKNLNKVYSESEIEEIRFSLHRNKSKWSETNWIKKLGIVAEPIMVEHLIYLLNEPNCPFYRSTGYEFIDDFDLEIINERCCYAIEAIEYIGGEKVFDWLHQAMYWMQTNYDYPNPFHQTVQALFRLDRSRTYTALEGAMQSYDPGIRKRAVIAIVTSDIPISDCNLSILLNAIDDPNLDVQLEIVKSIREIINEEDITDLTPELIDYAILITKPILLEHINHPDIEIRDRVIDLLSAEEPDEREAIVRAFGNISSNIGKFFEKYLYRIVKPADLPILLEYLEHDSIEIRACAAGAIGTIGDDSLLPLLVKLIHDPEHSIQAAAIRSIAAIGSATTFPVLLELAANPELVADLICKLNCPWERRAPKLAIIKEFHKDRDFTIEFLETAEQTLIENIRNSPKLSGWNIDALNQIGSDRSILPLYELLKSNCSGSDDPDEDPIDTVDAIIGISGDRSIPILLEFLANPTTLGGAIMRQFRYNGKLGVVPQLWSIQYQTYSSYLSAAILEIQEREGLYSPSFSDDVHPLFELGYPRLRDILLNCKG